MNRRALLARISQGAFNNVRFDDACNLAEGFGFALARVRGSHHVYAHPALPDLINLQDAKGEAKPYQLRQLLRIVERYNLKLEAGE